MSMKSGAKRTNCKPYNYIYIKIENAMNKTGYFDGIIAIVCLLVSCSPKVSSNMSVVPSRNATSDFVYIIDPSDEVLEDSNHIGTISITPRFLTTTRKGSFDKILETAKSHAMKMGGNAIVIVQHTYPDYYKSTHSIKADVFRLPEAYKPIKENGLKHPEYASVWFFRYPWMPGCTYNVYLGNELVYWSSANTKTEVKILEAGEYVVWAKGEKKVSISIKVEKGHDYYIETNISSGILSPNPALFLVSDYAGKDACNRM